MYIPFENEAVSRLARMAEGDDACRLALMYIPFESEAVSRLARMVEGDDV